MATTSSCVTRPVPRRAIAYWDSKRCGLGPDSDGALTGVDALVREDTPKIGRASDCIGMVCEPQWRFTTTEETLKPIRFPPNLDLV